MAWVRSSHSVIKPAPKGAHRPASQAIAVRPKPTQTEAQGRRPTITSPGAVELDRARQSKAGCGGVGFRAKATTRTVAAACRGLNDRTRFPSWPPPPCHRPRQDDDARMSSEHGGADQRSDPAGFQVCEFSPKTLAVMPIAPSLSIRGCRRTSRRNQITWEDRHQAERCPGQNATHTGPRATGRGWAPTADQFHRAHFRGR